MTTIGIIGLGLMGGSLGLALRQRRADVRVLGFTRRAEAQKKALAQGALHALCDTPTAVAAEADLLVLCTPVLTMPDMVNAIRPALHAGQIVTDVGSTKSALAAALTAPVRERGAVFVGSHPMAGSEQAGFEAARADLYDNATVAVTPLAETPPEAAEEVAHFWLSLGARVVLLDPGAHDLLVARTSHLPHLAASLLAQTVGRNRPAHLAEFCGPGFRDTSRVASGSPELWHDILKTNREAVLAELRAFRSELDALIRQLEEEDFQAVRRFLETARARRETLLNP